jgi:uridine monophosphate synthetase
MGLSCKHKCQLPVINYASRITHHDMTTQSQSLISNLHSIGCVKFGQFKLKSGLMSPIYIDLRLLVTHPHVLKQAAQAMAAVIADEAQAMSEPSKIENPKSKITFDRLAALPYAGLPIGVAVALETNKPLIYPRKEAKDYGTAKLIEGEYHAGETVLMVDDLITKGTAKLEALKPLTDEGLIVKDILVLIDREQGGAVELAQRGVALHAVFTLSQMLDELVDAGRLAPAQREEVLTWIKAN